MGLYRIVSLAVMIFFSLHLETMAAEEDWKTHPLEPANTSSPRDTLRTFLRNVNLGIESWRQNRPKEERLILIRQFLGCLDLSDIAPADRATRGVEKALLLKEILGRVKLTPLEEVPGPDEVEKQKLTSWTIPHSDLTMERQEDGDRAGSFLFSAETLKGLEEAYEIAKRFPYRPDAVPGVYEEVARGPGPLIPRHWVFGFPMWSFETVLGSALWKWIAVSAVLLVWALSICVLIVGALKFDRKRRDAEKPRRFALPLAAILIIALTYLARQVAFEAIGVRGGVWSAAQIVFWLAVFVATAWLATTLLNRVAEKVIASQHFRPTSLDSQFVRICFRLLAILLVTYIAVFGAEFFGIPITPLIAGLGIGGLAIGLAVRPTLENVVGGLILFTDKPVRVGDFCRFGDKIGTVEEIGLRSTRVRSLGRTVITIPNGEFSQLQLENYAHRDRILFTTKLGLRYETTAEQLRYLLASLRKMLIGHPCVLAEGRRVRFADFGENSLNIEIFAYVASNNWQEYLGIREDINLRIMDIVKEAGTGLALPSGTFYLARDAGLDADRSQAAEATVEKWRSDGELPFPDFDPEIEKDLDGRLDFPPRGSATPHDRPPSQGQGNQES